MATIRANANTELLAWARKSAGLTFEEVAKKIGGAKFNPERIENWEDGSEKPTVRQLRLMAKAYKRPLATFFLSEFPRDFTIPRDFRRLPGDGLHTLSAPLRHQLRRIEERREIARELYEELGETPPEFALSATLDEDPEALGGRIRKTLGVTVSIQASWRDPQRYKPLNQWRKRIEQQGILVFQFTDVEPGEALGFSIAESNTPVIAANRKVRPNGRIFTMMHEFVHVLVRLSGLCDIDESLKRPPEEQKIEVFCNRVAAAALIPATNLMDEPQIAREQVGPRDWDDEVIQLLAHKYSVSREVIVRRLLTIGRTSRAFYERKRTEYRDQITELERQRKKTKGFESPAGKVVSTEGPNYVRLVLDSYHQGHITLSDVSNYLEVRVKHLTKIEEALLGT